MSSTASHRDIVAGDGCQIGRFEAMHCPCEVLVEGADTDLASELLAIAIQEAERIENKFSRYRPGTVVDELNKKAGKSVEVDPETAGLLDFAAKAHAMSSGLFDITTGVLRHLWHFEGADGQPSREAIERMRAQMGWGLVRWDRPRFHMPLGFEIDLGGICKEYAADRILSLLRPRTNRSVLVNLGGDLVALGNHRWSVGIEDAARPGQLFATVPLRTGALATSGTTRRFIRVGERTLGHILDPRTGWPVLDAPRSVTVAAKTCTEAGFWSTVAVLQGKNAESFLRDNEQTFWCYR